MSSRAPFCYLWAHSGQQLFLSTLCSYVLMPRRSLYHFNALATNTTTIEGWEKDKVATLVRRGKIQEVRHFT